MSIFIEFKDTLVNIGKIKEISLARKDALRIAFDDGSTEVYSTYGDADRAAETLAKTVVQIIPCTAPLYNVYKDDGEKGVHFHERVQFLALCADGAVRSFADADMDLVLADEADNFRGIFTKDRLKDFPAAEA